MLRTPHNCPLPRKLATAVLDATDKAYIYSVKGLAYLAYSLRAGKTLSRINYTWSDYHVATGISVDRILRDLEALGADTVLFATYRSHYSTLLAQVDAAFGISPDFTLPVRGPTQDAIMRVVNWLRFRSAVRILDWLQTPLPKWCLRLSFSLLLLAWVLSRIEMRALLAVVASSDSALLAIAVALYFPGQLPRQVAGLTFWRSSGARYPSGSSSASASWGNYLRSFSLGKRVATSSAWSR